jgi:hypothetical protein
VGRDGLDVAMVAQAPAERFVPVELPRVAVSGDGSLAAIHESSRITLLELPRGAAFAEIGVDPDALASEVAWVGTPPRLLVLSRYDGNSTAHLIDPLGPRTIAEIRLEATMRLAATVGGWALAIGSLGTAVLASSDTYLTAYQFPARVVPVTAGAAAGQFLVALAGSIEEWDPQSRMPRRRLRLPRNAAITAVGGSERLVWMTTQQEPARIEVIPLVNRGQPRAHDLPEPILRTVGHPRSDLVACLGAETGRLYVVDLDGRTRLRIIDPEGIDRIDAASLVIGRLTGVLAAQAGHPIAVMRLDGRDVDLEGPGAAGPTAILPHSGALGGPVADERDVVAHGRSDVLPAGSSLYDDPSAPVSSSLDEASPGLAPPHHHAAPGLSADSLDQAPDDASSDAPDPPPSGALALSTDPSPAGAPWRLTDPPENAPPLSIQPSPSSLGESPGIPPWSPSPDPRAAGPQPSLDEPIEGARASAPTVGRSPFRPSAFDRTAAASHATSTVFRAAGAPPPAARQPPLQAGKPAPSVSERFSAWRDMVRQNQTHAAPGAPSSRRAPPSPDASSYPTAGPIAAAAASSGRGEPSLSWRDELAAWSSTIGGGTIDPAAHGPPVAFAIEALIARFELEPPLQPVIALLYGAHLRGEAGVAPLDVARMLDRQWDEALGRGDLARTGLCEYVRSRVALSPVILRALDELPPLTGTLLGPPGPIALLGPCVVVARDESLAAVAERCLPHVGGAILVAHPDIPCPPLVFEARAYGAAAMLRPHGGAAPGNPQGLRPALTTASDPVIFVVDDAELADRLGVPRLA